MGESVTEGSIVEWRKKVGEWIDEGDTLVEVTTDKVDVEVPATASGVITALLAAEGDTIAVGASLAEIDPSAPKPSGGAAAPAAPPASAAPPAPANTASAPVPPLPTSTRVSAGGPNATSRAFEFCERTSSRYYFGYRQRCRRFDSSARRDPRGRQRSSKSAGLGKRYGVDLRFRPYRHLLALRPSKGLNATLVTYMGAELNDSDGDKLPYVRRLRAREATCGSERIVESGGSQRKDLVYAFDCLRHRPYRTGNSRVGCDLPSRRNDATTCRVRRESRACRRCLNAKTVHAFSWCRSSKMPISSALRPSMPPTMIWLQRRVKTS